MIKPKNGSTFVQIVLATKMVSCKYISWKGKVSALCYDFIAFKNKYWKNTVDILGYVNFSCINYRFADARGGHQQQDS